MSYVLALSVTPVSREQQENYFIHGAMDRSNLSASMIGIRVGLLFAIPALLAWLSGRSLLFPSLGPTALALFLDEPETKGARRVIGGHLIGLLAGFVSYHALAEGLNVSDLPPRTFNPRIALGAERRGFDRAHHYLHGRCPGAAHPRLRDHPDRVLGITADLD